MCAKLRANGMRTTSYDNNLFMFSYEIFLLILFYATFRDAHYLFLTSICITQYHLEDHVFIEKMKIAFWRSLFVLFFRPLCCLSFIDLRIRYLQTLLRQFVF